MDDTPIAYWRLAEPSGTVAFNIGSLIGVGPSLVAGVCALSFSLLTISVAWLFYRPLIRL